ncbi:putative Xylose isomerase-like TIM barrel domain-containing protein [Seiridium cardinale]|uniref:Xylose isomerase-like TIM barrel domain-containing protein n=1 Tax=Seiridium cardinale TaxID=138064 RepID=A0ABR2Y0I3_9PEZI
MEIKRLRTLWGVEPGEDMSEWDKLFPELVKIGFDGIEIDTANLQPPDFPKLRALCDKHGLAITALIFSSWPQYVGPRPKGLTPDDHLKFYREQIKQASVLKPLKINAHSGSDVFTPEQSVEFYKGTFAIDEELGFAGRVTHETHRNRSLFNPQATGYILSRVPNLRITLDISHWVVVSERLLDTSEEDIELIEQMVPHVEHIHARIGTTQASQCPEPMNPAFREEREFFERTWLRVLEHRLKSNDTRPLTFVPEYGPFPYHPINSKQTHGEVANSEATRLYGMFGAFIASSQKS